MEGGQVTESGKYEELMIGGTTFEQLVLDQRSILGLLDGESGSNEHEQNVESTEEMKEDKPDHSDEEKEVEIVIKPAFQLIEEEEREVGVIGWKDISEYIIISDGLFYACCSTIAQLGFVALQGAASYWLALSVQKSDKSSLFVVEVYTLISLLSVGFVHLRSLFAVFLGLKASESFFSGFINSIFDAPMLFFDSTPVGRILTRVCSSPTILS